MRIYGGVKTFLSKVDPRVKIGWIILVNAVGVLTTDMLVLAALAALTIALAWASNLAKETLLQFKAFWLIMLVIGIIQGTTIRVGRILFHIIPPEIPLIGGSLPVYETGLYYGVTSLFRLVLLTLPIFMLTASTSISEFINTLLWFKIPYQYALMFALALNFFPNMLAEISSMMDGLRARGLGLADGNILQRIMALKYILIPLSLNAVEKADMVGRVLETRSYGTVDIRPYFSSSKKATTCFTLVIITYLVAPLIPLFT